jgi:hypothetical protein
MQCAVRTGFLVLMPIMPELFARQVFYVSFNIPATLSVFDNTVVQKYTPPTQPLQHTFIWINFLALFSYFVGNYFSFHTVGLQCEFKVQPAKSIEI